jgi:hypothetical protein
VGGCGARELRKVGLMYLFTRQTRLANGNGTAGLDWATSVARKVKEVTGQDVDVWSTVYSAGVGTISWTGWVADLASLEEVGDKLNADPGMNEMVNRGASLIDGSLDDGLLEPIYGEPDPTAALQYVGGVVAVASAGSIERAMTIGIEIAQKAEAITGLQTMFVRSLTGPYGGVGWLTGYETITAMEEAQNALAGEPTWLKLIDSTKGCFVEDAASTQATIYRRLA